LTADGPLADDADEVEADVNESTAENFLFAWKMKMKMLSFRLKFNFKHVL
jgi:hypothetical protein